MDRSPLHAQLGQIHPHYRTSFLDPEINFSSRDPTGMIFSIEHR